MRRLWSSLVLAGLPLVLACSRAPIDDEGSETTAASGSSDSADGSTDESGTSESGETGGLPETLCDCAEGELCVASCAAVAPGIPTTNSMPEDYRCLDDSACEGDSFDVPACRAAACGSHNYELEDKCSIADLDPGIDIRCSADLQAACDPGIQDCPDEEKCVGHFDEFDPDTAKTSCVPLEGAGAPGDPCTTEGAPDYGDSCGAASQCWTGMLSPDPSEGVCREFCQLDMPECPEGSTCQHLGGELGLCIPD